MVVRRVLRLLPVAGLAAAAVALSGCGTSTVGNVIDPVAKAATVSNQASGMRMNFRLALSIPGLPAPLVGNGSGTFDVAGHSGSVTMQLGGIPQLAAVLGTSTIRIDEIIDGLTVYLKLPAALTGGGAQHGKPWVKIDVGKAASAAGVSGLSSLIDNPTSNDPSQFLRYLRAASGGVKKVGSATVDGFQTTEYKATIDLNRVPNAEPAASRAEVRRAVTELEQAGHIHSLPVTVWIDGQHLVRRMAFSFNESVSGQSLAVNMRIDIPEYGPQPSPQLPPASQVTDLTPHLGAGSSSAGAVSGI